ncbi:MAG: transglutaminase-like domain-containing protein, partial [Fervidobacterium sp.]
MTYAEQCKKKNEFAITLILFLILLLDLSYSKPLKATFNVTITWDVIADGILENASLDVTIPTNSQNQKIISMEFSDPYKLVADSESKIRFEFSNVRAKRITANFTVETNYLERYNYLANGTKDNYISNSTYVIIDKDISNLANQFNQSSPYDLYEMQKWVYQNIKYNASFTDVSINDITYSNMPSTWVLEKRTGVCDEFSNLFAAMSRAKGYPTRIILGYAYVDKKWIPHAWTEVYSPDYGWIEIDPTHNQFMNLNALRVRTGVGSDISLLHDSISAVSKDA